MLDLEGNDVKFELGSGMYELTCVNHPQGKWLTKHPLERHLHWIGWFDENGNRVEVEDFGFYKECPCPYSDLRVRSLHP